MLACSFKFDNAFFSFFFEISSKPVKMVAFRTEGHFFLEIVLGEKTLPPQPLHMHHQKLRSGYVPVTKFSQNSVTTKTTTLKNSRLKHYLFATILCLPFFKVTYCYFKNVKK